MAEPYILLDGIVKITPKQGEVVDRLVKYGFKISSKIHTKCIFCNSELFNADLLKSVISPNGKLGYLKKTILYYLCLDCECFYEYDHLERGKTIEEFASLYSENKLELLKEYKLKLLQACRTVQDDIDTLMNSQPVTSETFSYRQ